MGLAHVGGLAAAPIGQNGGGDGKNISLYIFTVILIRPAGEPRKDLLGQIFGFHMVAHPALEIGDQGAPETLVIGVPGLRPRVHAFLSPQRRAPRNPSGTIEPPAGRAKYCSGKPVPAAAILSDNSAALQRFIEHAQHEFKSNLL